MTGTVLDYGHWDSMQQFASNPTKMFIQDNLSDYTFESLELDVFVIYNEKSEVVWYHDKDLETGEQLDITTLLANNFDFDQYISNLDDGSFGTVTLASNSFIYGTTDICNSNGDSCGGGHILALRKLRPSIEAR